jgi:alanine racemase
VDKGAPIGYGATPCAHDGVIAILAIGYGDGFFNSYHGAKLNYKGHEGTVVGRVNMDMTYVLFKKEVLKDLVLHDKFYIWDSKDSLERFCGNTKTIAHEVICSLSPRVFRNYLN